VLGNYATFDLLIPSKIGLTFGTIFNEDKTLEFEYLRGSFAIPFLIKDLGQMTDTRYSLIKRNYFGGNSFNMSYGISYFDFSMTLGNSLITAVSSGNYPEMDLVEVKTLGLNIGIGNRWTFKHNITLGVDWISWNQPLFVTTNKSVFLDHATNQQDKDDVQTAMKVISYFPHFSFLKLQFGMLF
jgi:hypothetical protein